MDKVSVIVPAYNAEKTIEQCLRSICGNDTKGLFDFEVIVVNDGSKDNTVYVVELLQHEYLNLRLINQSNSGPSAARKLGISQSTGEYLAFCDSDDWVEPNWLSAMYCSIVEENADISIIRALINEGDINSVEYKEYAWDNNHAIKAYLEHRLINGSFVIKMFRKNLFDNIHFDTTMSYCEDDYVLWQMLQNVKKIVRREIPTYHIRVHEGSLTTSKFKKERWTSTKRYFDTVLHDCETSEELTPLLKQAEKYHINWYFSLMKMMIRDSFYDKEVIAELQRVYRLSGLSAIGAFDRVKDKFAYVLSLISVPFVFKILRKAL